MGWIIAIAMMIYGLIVGESSWLIAAGLFAVAGSISEFGNVIRAFGAKTKE